MRKILFYLLLFFMGFVQAAENEPEPSDFTEEFLEIISIVKTETTVREWKLFCEITQREVPALFFAMPDDAIMNCLGKKLLTVHFGC